MKRSTNYGQLPIGIVLLALLAILPVGAQPGRDDIKIRAIAVAWEAAWNSHDMKALFTLFTNDADFVNVGARHWKGRAEIEKEHAARRDQFLDSAWTNNSVEIQYLKNGIALVHIGWTLTGDKDPDGTARPPRGGIFTWILVRIKGKWLIRAAQNTNLGNLQQPILPKKP